MLLISMPQTIDKLTDNGFQSSLINVNKKN